jgi:DMSO reductase anchor subunit
MMALVLVVLFLGRHRRFARFHKRLIIIARLILLSIGIILLVYPLLLANLWASILVLFGSVLMGSLLERIYEQDN